MSVNPMSLCQYLVLVVYVTPTFKIYSLVSMPFFSLNKSYCIQWLLNVMYCKEKVMALN